MKAAGGSGVGFAIGLATCHGDTTCILRNTEMGAAMGFVGPIAEGFGLASEGSFGAMRIGGLAGGIGELVNQTAEGHFSLTREAEAIGIGAITAAPSTNSANTPNNDSPASPAAPDNLSVRATSAKPSPWRMAPRFGVEPFQLKALAAHRSKHPLMPFTASHLKQVWTCKGSRSP